MRVFTDLLRPSTEPVAVSLYVLLMIWRHMCFYCAVLIGSAVKPWMRTDTFASVEHFYRRSRNPNVNLLFDVFIRNRVILFIYGNMVIRGNCGDFLFQKFKQSFLGAVKETAFLLQIRLHGSDDTKTNAGIASPVSVSMTVAVSPTQSTCMNSPGL